MEGTENFKISASVHSMLNIAQIAVQIDELERVAAIEKDDLKTAYIGFKVRHGYQHVSRDTPEWEAMMAATKGEYAASEAAKRKVYNAKRRLKKAIEAARSR